MDCEFVKIYVVSSDDGSTIRPEGYFLNILEANLFLKNKNSAYYSLEKKSLDGIRIEDKFYLLGQQIDVNFFQKKRQESLINSAKGKLTPEEWDALINKGK